MNITIFLSLTLLAAPAAQVLYEDSFDGNAFDPGWTVDASTGNEVRLEGGAAAFYADENTYAHLERALGLVLRGCENIPGQSPCGLEPW